MIADARANIGDHEIGEVEAVYGSWAVTNYGLTCLTEFYRIRKQLLEDPWWLLDHMDEKGWVNMTDFIRAMQDARRRGYFK